MSSPLIYEKFPFFKHKHSLPSNQQKALMYEFTSSSASEMGNAAVSTVRLTSRVGPLQN